MADSYARRRYTIVGIDPGTTVGIAMIDLQGKPVEVFSAKNYSISDAIAWIAARGRPLIVASDVTPTPAMVKKISSVFASPVHDLGESLSTDEKIALTKGEDYEYKNAHERDALAACVNAFKHYKRKFTQVQKKTPAGVNMEAVKAMVIKGVSISAAIDRLIAPEEEKEQVTEELWHSEGDSGVEREREQEQEDGTILRLRGLLKDKDARIELLEERITALETRLEEGERERERLKHKLDSTRSASMRALKKTEEIRKRDRAIESLRAEVRTREQEKAELRGIIDDLKGQGKREVMSGKRVTVIHAFSQDAILDTDRKYGLNKGDVVFLKEGSGGGTGTAELLAQKGVVAVIYGKELSHFAAATFSEFGIPTFSIDELPLLSSGDEGEEGPFAFVDPHLLNERIEEWKRARREKEVILLQR